ncbi:hypothetical protein ESZ50_04655 [Weissella muntiaci]|uniref:Uncharacterized protein n=1 Tax=Weissella muntiaci TaxID=2508881 RepID=A0A6C2CA11_9LACO|nr:hypothetical protein [Weissella muntiaci]TYC49885.1 hypothetical protein ESZ50_04655 [Weissella muntiaci]
MAKLKGARFTDAGLAAAADLFNHKQENKVTKMSIASVSYKDKDISKLTRLSDEILTALPSDIVRNGNVFSFTGVFDSTRISKDSYINSIGVYISDINNVETLLAVVDAETPDFIPAGGLDNQNSIVYSVNLSVTNSNVTFSLEIDDNAIAQMKDLAELSDVVDGKLKTLHDQAVLLTGDQSVGGVKIFKDGVVGNLSGRATAAGYVYGQELSAGTDINSLGSGRYFAKRGVPLVGLPANAKTPFVLDIFESDDKSDGLLGNARLSDFSNNVFIKVKNTVWGSWGQITSEVTDNTWTGTNKFTQTISASITGNSGTATKLSAARTMITDLTQSSSVTFDGTKNIVLGIQGVLPTAKGGTGNANGFVNGLNVQKPLFTDLAIVAAGKMDVYRGQYAVTTESLSGLPTGVVQWFNLTIMPMSGNDNGMMIIVPLFTGGFWYTPVESGKIVGWVNVADDKQVVHTTGAETIDGIKKYLVPITGSFSTRQASFLDFVDVAADMHKYNGNWVSGNNAISNAPFQSNYTVTVIEGADKTSGEIEVTSLTNGRKMYSAVSGGKLLGWKEVVSTDVNTMLTWQPNMKIEAGQMITFSKVGDLKTGQLTNPIFKAKVAHTTGTTFPSAKDAATLWELVNVESYKISTQSMMFYGLTARWHRQGDRVMLNVGGTFNTDNVNQIGSMTVIGEKVPSTAFYVADYLPGTDARQVVVAFFNFNNHSDWHAQIKLGTNDPSIYVSSWLGNGQMGKGDSGDIVPVTYYADPLTRTWNAGVPTI